MANYPNYGYSGQQGQQMPAFGPQTAQNGQICGGGLSPSSRPVLGREEAQAAPADFSGALMVFPDLSHGRVWVKRWNMQMGVAEFAEFVLAQPAPPPEYVTVDVWRAELDRLRQEMAEMRGGNGNE